MKRALLAMLLAMLLAVPAMAEIETYADQGGVMVFSEEGKVGLMDGEGNILLPAEYEDIAPFQGDYAVVTGADGSGLVRRDGTLALNCEWDVAWADGDLGFVWDDWYDRQVIDLDTGEVLMSGRYRFWAEGDRVFRLSYGYYDGWGEKEPPFQTDVFDRDMNRLFSVDHEIEKRLGEDRYIAGDVDVDGNWRRMVLDADGGTLVDGIKHYEVSGDGEVTYVRNVKNALGMALEALGYDHRRVRNGIIWYLGATKDQAELLAAQMDDWTVCGILRPDGSRTERRGEWINPRDDAGLYCIATGGMYGYMDGEGRWALEPVYEYAFPFVGGTAEVYQDGRWRLIDPRGERVGGLEWSDEQQWEEGGQTIAVAEGQEDEWKLRLFTRQGEPIVDEAFPVLFRWWSLVRDDIPTYIENWPWEQEGRIVVGDSEGRMCLVDPDTGAVRRVKARAWGEWPLPGVMEVCVDRL